MEDLFGLYIHKGNSYYKALSLIQKSSQVKGCSLVIFFIYISFNFNGLGPRVLKFHCPFAEGHILSGQMFLNNMDDFIITLKM